MKEVIFSKYGEAVPDFKAEDYAYKLLTEDKLHIYNESVLNWIRVMVKEGAIDVNDIKFTFIDPWEDTVIPLLCDRNGKFQHWPRGLDTHVDALCRLLK
jgi:hypothetical protein